MPGSNPARLNRDLTVLPVVTVEVRVRHGSRALRRDPAEPARTMFFRIERTGPPAPDGGPARSDGFTVSVPHPSALTLPARAAGQALVFRQRSSSWFQSLRNPSSLCAATRIV